MQATQLINVCNALGCQYGAAVTWSASNPHRETDHVFLLWEHF